MTAPVVYTIGHGAEKLLHFLSNLERHGITLVVDVRSRPYSRISMYNRDQIEGILQRNGISYTYLGKSLGGKPADECFYDEQGYVLYALIAESPFFKDGVRKVVAEAKAERVALLCAEIDPTHCHRHLLVGRVLDAAGVAVVHLLPDGTRETYAEAEERDRGAGGRQGGLFPGSEPWRSRRPVGKPVPVPPLRERKA